MSDLLTPISDFVQTQLEASRRLSDALFSGAGKIDHAVLDAARHALDEQLRFAQAIGNTRDPQTCSNLQSTFWANKPNDVQMFQKKMVQIFTEMQNDLGRTAQSYMEQISIRSMRGMPSNPVGASDRTNPSVVNPFGSMMSAWQNTMRGMSSMADQAISAARTGATRAGMAAAQTGAQAVSDAATTFAHKVSSVDEADHIDLEGDISDDEANEADRPQNLCESRNGQKKSSQPRRKL